MEINNEMDRHFKEMNESLKKIADLVEFLLKRSPDINTEKKYQSSGLLDQKEVSKIIRKSEAWLERER